PSIPSGYTTHPPATRASLEAAAAARAGTCYTGRVSLRRLYLTGKLTPAQLVVLVAGAMGCNLVSSDLTRVTIQLPIETYMIDTTDHNTVALPQMVPAAQCTGDPACCPSGCQQNGYVLGCSGGRCQATITATLVARVDLSSDTQLTRAKSVTDMQLKSIEYAI